VAQTVAILGATGLVGATLTELLLARGRAVRPVIHSPGNAWRLARLGVELHRSDILEPARLTETLRGCEVVVNCTRGGPKQLIDGFRNVLDCARAAGVRRIVHISSVAVYGEPPSRDSHDESGGTEPQKETYGWYKLLQDQMLQKATGTSLESVILCPPNIIGAYGYFPLKLLDTLTTGTFAYVEDGTGPCNTVDVFNLAHAIDLAMRGSVTDGRRLFVTDAEPTTWRDLVEPLRSVVPTTFAPRSVSREEAVRLTRPAPARQASLGRSLRHLVSSDVREALRKDPLLAKADMAVRKTVARLGRGTEEKLRMAVEGPRRVAKQGDPDAVDTALLTMALREVRHSCARAQADLGYQPFLSVAQSMEAFTRWVRDTRGMDDRDWHLGRELYT
jgi:nucleoside-diphosphate-sugar epimerase